MISACFFLGDHPIQKKVSNWVSSPTTGITPLRVLTNQAYEMLLTINQFLRDDPPSGAYPQGYSSYLVFRGKTAPWRLVGILGLDGLGCMATALLPQGI